jgi:hypothetical protein
VPPTLTPTPCSLFSCPNGDLPDLDLTAGDPNDSIAAPCTAPTATPPISSTGTPTTSLDSWINAPINDDGNHDMQPGQRAVYYACAFPDALPPIAEMAGPNSVETLTVLPVPVTDQDTGQQWLIVWNITCNLQIGPYTLTVRDGQGREATLSFNLNDTSRQRILAVPRSTSPGMRVQIYYCNYATRADKEVAIDLYYKVGEHLFRHINSWNIPINADGWATQSLDSFDSDLPGIYLIRDHEEGLKGYEMVGLEQ